jgi:tripartite-type tricarboxylate transporter receptor subunit TctC
MKLLRREFLRLAAGCVALPAVSRSADAQAYPSRPVTMIVPYPAGGAFDTIGRILADSMSASLGQSIVVENVSGGGNGTVGVGVAARAAPDGYTLILGNWGTHVVNGATYTLQYDLVRDFASVSLVVTAPQVIVSKNAVPANDLRDLIAWLRANPDKTTLATVGPGSPPHVAGLFFQKLTDTRFQFVPYRGAAPAVQDLIGGHVDFSIFQAAAVLPAVSAGKIRAYAVTAATRLDSARDIPSADEAGMPGLHVSAWSGLWAPKGTPGDIIARLNAAVVDALADPASRQRFAKVGQEIPPREQQTTEALAALQKAEIEKWWPIVRAANIKGE